MMRFLKLSVAVAALLLSSSCSDIDGLNDYNAVFAFEITESQGAGGSIDLGEIRTTADAVYIQVLHGIHNFPLRFKGEPKFENPIDRVAGMDFSDWVEIDLQRDGESGQPLLDERGNYLFEEPKFYVQALSGLPREYTFRIEYAATSSDADVFPAVILREISAGTPAADLLTIVPSEDAKSGGTAYLNVVNPSFPLKVTPEFTVSDGAALEGNGETSYEFGSDSDTHTFEVVAKDGTVKRWTLALALLPAVNASSDGYDEAVLLPTNLEGFKAEAASRGFLIEEYGFSASVEGDFQRLMATNISRAAGKNSDGSSSALYEAATRTHSRSGGAGSVAAAGKAPARAGYVPADTLKLYISIFSENPFPMNVNLELPSVPGVSFFGEGKEITFPSMDSTHEFWLLDTGNRIARRWVVALEEYHSPAATVMSFSYEYTATEVRESSLSGPRVPAIVMDEERTADIDHINHCIYLRAVEIHNPKYASVDPWKLSLAVDIKVSAGASLVDLSGFEWSGVDSWKMPKTFGVQASDGTVYKWKVIVRDWSDGEPEASDECELYGVTVTEVRPYVVELEPEPLTLDAGTHTVTLNLRRDDGGYPLSLTVGYALSEYARISTQNGGRDPLVFDSPDDVNIVEVVSESGRNSRQWTFRLRPPVKESGTDVTSFKIVSFSDNGFGAEVAGIDHANAVINMNFTRAGSFPVTMNFRMGLSYKAVSSITDSYGAGSIEFSAVEDKIFTVTAQNGETREWTLRASYMPQLRNAGFESWEDLRTPLPKGIKGNPYWASANMTSPVVVEGTTQTEGAPGQGKAVQLKTTNTIIGKLASGSLFLGWFDDSNPIGSMNDPTVMTFQGIPFSSNKPIKGFSADVCYHPGGGDASDAGSLAIELIRQRDPSQELEYHGRRPGGEWHPNNNADMVARGQAVVAVKQGSLDNGDTATHVVAAGEWQNIFVPLEYEGAYPSYTHLSIICSSSSQGDAFKGSVGSTLKIDNIRLVYEE